MARVFFSRYRIQQGLPMDAINSQGSTADGLNGMGRIKLAEGRNFVWQDLIFSVLF